MNKAPEKQLKCWEFKKCRQSDCPVHNQDTGEICYSIRKTLCEGRIQGSGFDKFIDTCINCDFYELLRRSRL